MNRDRAFEMVGQANPLPRDAAGPDEFLSMTALLEEVDRRVSGGERPAPVDRPVKRGRDMQTSEQAVRVLREPRPARRRRPGPALAAAIATVVVVVGAWVLTRTPAPDLASRTPIELTELFDDGVAAGDGSAIAELFSEGATWQMISPQGESPVFGFFDELPPEADIADWDADGVLTEMDVFASLGAEIYASGTTDLLTCSQPEL